MFKEIIMKISKRVICILLTTILIGTIFAGCGNDKDNIDFIYPFSANVRSYDPQVASTSDEYLIIENTFEGLIRIDDDGTIKKGVADSWEISADKLTYTFHLKKGLKWDINTDKNDAGEFKDDRLEMLGKEFNPDITANDFVFALRRACQPETECPLFSTISAIKNANSVRNGKMKSTALGVKARDNYTLVITLTRADDNFMNALTTAAAMPCNEEFFNATKGRYGLSTKYTLFNGQFYVNQILESSYLLKKNEYYGGDFPASAKELTLKIPSADESDKNKLNKIESGYYDAAFIRGDETEQLKKKDGITYMPYDDTTWAFVLNTKNEIMQSKSVRKAFCQGFSRLDDTGKEYLKPAKTLTPKSCMIESKPVGDFIGTTVIPENRNESIQSWKKGLDILDMSSLEITVITPDYMEEYTKRMMQGIQAGLASSLTTKSGDSVDLTLKIQAMPLNELKKAVRSKDYAIALYPFDANSSSALSFLEGVADINASGFNNANMKSALSDANKQKSTNDIAKYIKRAERSAILSYSICPMLYETSYYVAATGVSGIQFHPGTGRVSFVNATR